jgi:multisubunit Na+/H+ antiporter MnhG subunit
VIASAMWVSVIASAMWVSDALLAGGVAVLLLCAVGLLVMRSPYDRLHYASASVWGLLLVAAAIFAHERWSLIADKALLAAFVLLVCGPALAHATARATRMRQRGEWNAPAGLRHEGARRGARTGSPTGRGGGR